MKTIREALKTRPPRLIEVRAGHAAVALVFAGAPQDLSLCFIQRAVRDRDHWSGQMAFPGGRAEDGDPSPRGVAERETLEEVGLDLSSAEFLGRLDELYIRRSGIVTQDVLSPFAYYAGPALPPLSADAVEVADAYWIPVRYIWDPANRTVFERSRGDKVLQLHGIRYEGQVIWGLTHMMLSSLGELAGSPL